MREAAFAMLLFVIVVLMSGFVGWSLAERAIQRDCENLNGFWTEGSVYECRKTERQVK